MLSFLLYLLLVCSVVAQSRNQTLQFSDSALSFSSGWKASRAGNGELVFLFDNVGATALVINLPPLVSHITYTGLGRNQGSLYGVCVDCNQDFTGISVFDAHDPGLANNSLATSVDIFSLCLDPSKRHIITILDVPDSRFNGQSELTFLSATITIDDGEVQTTTKTTSSTSSTSSTSVSLTSSTSFSTTYYSSVFASPSISSSSTASPSATAASSNTLNSTTRNSIIAVISILTFIGVGSLLLGIFFYRRRKLALRRKDKADDALDDGFGRVGGSGSDKFNNGAAGPITGGADSKGSLNLPMMSVPRAETTPVTNATTFQAGFASSVPENPAGSSPYSASGFRTMSVSGQGPPGPGPQLVSTPIDMR